MKKFQFNGEYSQEEVTVEIVTYSNGRPAIQLSDLEGFPFMTASVNVPHIHLEEDEVVIKDYSENEGVLRFLVDNNIVIPTPYDAMVGRTMCTICILQPEDKWLDNAKEPIPVDYNEEGKKKWVIDGYNIWASSYQDALSHYAIIRQL